MAASTINRAIISCGKSGNNPNDHFAGAGKMIGLGSGGERKLEAAKRIIEIAIEQSEAEALAYLKP